jgi:hypothetical protein
MPITIKNSAGGGVTLDSTTSSNETLQLPSGGGTLAPLASPVFTGNVGIGVTPETWGTNGDFTGLQVGTGLSLYGRGAGDEDRVGMMGNAYHDATNDRYEYIGTGHATHYAHSDGQHLFQVAPSGTADAAISWTTAMTITNDGRGLSDFTALCWCSWNMSNSSIKDSHNISSIQDNGVGRQRPIMTNSASDANYAGVANGNAVNNWNGVETTVLGVNTSGPDVYHQESGSTYDATNVFVICFGG